MLNDMRKYPYESVLSFPNKGFCVPQQRLLFVGALRNELLLLFLMNSTPMFPVDNEQDGALTRNKARDPANFLLNADWLPDSGPFPFHLSFSGNLKAACNKDQTDMPGV